MKTIRFLIIVFVTLFTTNVLAVNYGDYSIVVNENGNMNVYNGCNMSGEAISNYQDIISYNDNIISISENTRICYLKSNIDITITSNDKDVYLYQIYSTSNGFDVRYRFVNFRDQFVDDHNTGFIMIGPKMSVEVIDSYFNTGAFQIYENSDAPDGRERVIMKNATVDRGSIESYRGTYIEKSNLNMTCIEEWNRKLTIKNSNIKTSADVSNYSTSLGDTDIIDSIIECTGNESFFGIGNGGGSSGQFNIIGSTIKGYRFENMSSNYTSTPYTKIIDSTIENISYIQNSNPTYVYNSTIKTPLLRNYSSYAYDPNNGLWIKDSLVYSDKIYASANMIVDNSYIDSKSFEFIGLPVTTEFNISNSYARFVSDNEEGSIILANKMIVHNSNLLAETNKPGYLYHVNRTAQEFYGATIEIDDDLQLIDKNDRLLYLNTYGMQSDINMPQEYKLVYDDDKDTYANSLKLISKANITFKVENGTWADGTNRDIQITKDVWTKLSSDEIPVGMIGDTEGSWEIEPNTEDYVKGNITYVYKFKKKGIVKGVIEELTENPKTGVFRYSFITLVLLCISILVYRRLAFNRYFKYK